jgi:hypothetical protein
MSLMDVFNLSACLQWAGSFLIFLVAFFLIKEKTRTTYSIGIYGVASFLFQALQFFVFFFLKGKYNTVIGNIYFPVEIITLLFIYYYAFNNKKLSYTVLALCGIILIFYALTISKQLTSLNTNTETVRDFVMIICAMIYFFELLRDLPQQNVVRLPMFWINSAVLFYFSCTFMLSLSLDYLTGILKDNLIGYWTFRNFLRVVFCATICFGLWQAKREGSTNIA